MRKSLVVGIIFLILAIVGVAFLYFYVPSGGVSQSSIEQQVANFYELANPGATAQVVAVDQESGVYHMIVKLVSSQGTNFAEVWVTTDGKFLTANPVLLQQSVTNLKSLANFVNCLNSKNLKIYGTSNSTGTQLQLNILGTFSPEIFSPCDNNIQACVDARVRWNPTIAYGNSSYPGPQPLSFFENITGCQLTS